MRKSSEMYIVSRVQNMGQICARNGCVATKLHFGMFCNNSFGDLGVDSLHGGAMPSLSTDGLQPDVICFNAVMSACARGGQCHKSRVMVEPKQTDSIPPDLLNFELVRLCGPQHMIDEV